MRQHIRVRARVHNFLRVVHFFFCCRAGRARITSDVREAKLGVAIEIVCFVTLTAARDDDVSIRQIERDA